MDFYLLSENELNGFCAFDREKYAEVCWAICNLDPKSRSYYSKLEKAERLAGDNGDFFHEGEAKTNLAVIREALKREHEDVGLKKGKIPRYMKDIISDQRKMRKSMLEVGYRMEFI